MILPAIELKLSRIIEASTYTEVTATISRVEEQITTPEGSVYYRRTLLRRFTRRFGAGWDINQFGPDLRQELLNEAIDRGMPITEDRIICDVG